MRRRIEDVGRLMGWWVLILGMHSDGVWEDIMGCIRV